MLAEMGARVLRVERMGGGRDFLGLPKRYDLDRHGRHIVKLDLKRPEGVALLREIATGADVLIEGFRPGVMERFRPRSGGTAWRQSGPRLWPHDGVRGGRTGR